ncbi:glycosyltransferase [Carnobacterium sp. TMP28]|uniref:glycosyltransferase n=1 Tax=Carnobacterium sp. TMP28 TaxID=3397060 RepID=UPI0039DF3F4E
MKILHVNAGQEEGGAKTHILSLLSQFPPDTAELLVLEEGSVAKEARSMGLTLHVLNQRSRYDVTIINRLADFITSNQYDVVHTHGARANLFLALIKNKISSTWVSTIHSDPGLDFMDKGLKGTVFSLLNSWSFKKADQLIAVTEELKKTIIQKGISKERVYVIYNGIAFDNTIAKIHSQTVFTLTCIARLHPIKAHDFLLDSLKASSLSNFHLNIIGDGELRAALEQKVATLGFQDRVQFHGALEKKQIEDILHQTDATVLASLSEGFPLVLLESANQHVPFISTNVGDVAKLVPDPSYGWLVAVQDKTAYAAALKEAFLLWQSNDLAKKGENLFQLASKEYSLNKMYLETLAVYQVKN